jgi:hypothetical protein
MGRRESVVTEESARPADHLGRLIRVVWLAALVLGAAAGLSLARIRSSRGLTAANAVLKSWKNLPWTFAGHVPAWLGTEAMIGAGILLPVLIFLVPRQVRQNSLTLVGHLVFAVIAACAVGAIMYFVGVFVYDLGPYFRFRG